MARKNKLSKISALHFVRLILRSILFIAVLTAYILDKIQILKSFTPLLAAVWVFFITEMILRFFPSRLESMGGQKQFKRNYEPVGEGIKPINQTWQTTALIALVWIALNAVFGALYLTGIFDRGIMILIAIAYSVCDIICILFFCPFQVWFMKNRCCTTCRIYNWDFAMMFTPLAFIPGVYYYSLLGCALVLLIRWELTYRLHPERFSVATNHCLECSRCKERLCARKKRL